MRAPLHPVQILVLVLAALIIAAGVSQFRAPKSVARETACTVIDGDTLDCAGERIRLNGIDAPEMPGHCREGRQCVAGDPWDSAANLSLGLSQGPVTIERLKRDRYGRTVAEVRAGLVDLSCWQVATRNAEYVERWDEGGRTAAACS